MMTNSDAISRDSNFNEAGERIPEPIGVATISYFDGGSVLVSFRYKGQGYTNHRMDTKVITAVAFAMGIPGSVVDAVCSEIEEHNALR